MRTGMLMPVSITLPIAVGCACLKYAGIGIFAIPSRSRIAPSTTSPPFFVAFMT